MHTALLSSLASAEPTPHGFRTALDEVLAFLRANSAADLLDGERDGAAICALFEEFTGQLEHVGLMAPPGMSVDEVARVASATGFDLRPMSFPSMLVARELGTLSGIESLATTIFRSSAEGTKSRRVGVEVFIPNTDDATIRRWIREGVCSHVAIELHRPHDAVFAKVAAHFETAGFNVPAFVVPRPFFVPNPENDLRTLYFDRIRGTERSRIEVFALGDLLPRPSGRRLTDSERGST